MFETLVQFGGTCAFFVYSLRKLVHAINTDFLALQIENFQQKIFDIFLIFAQNIDCGTR